MGLILNFLVLLTKDYISFPHHILILHLSFYVFANDDIDVFPCLSNVIIKKFGPGWVGGCKRTYKDYI